MHCRLVNHWRDLSADVHVLERSFFDELWRRVSSQMGCQDFFRIVATLALLFCGDLKSAPNASFEKVGDGYAVMQAQPGRLQLCLHELIWILMQTYEITFSAWSCGVHVVFR